MTLDEALNTLVSVKDIWDTWDASALLDFLASEKKKALAAGDQNKAKKIWFYEETADAHTHYIKAFKEMRQGSFYEGWRELANAEISLERLDRHRAVASNDFYTPFIAQQTSRFQSAFPYRVFLSPELLIDKKTCSVCGLAIGIRVSCGHAVGEVYDGIYCTRVHHIAGCISISLVTNPVQKYSVLRSPAEDFHDYSIIKFIIDRVTSPYHGWSITWTTRRHPHERFKTTLPSAPCPCGAEVEYEKCCFSHPEGVLRPHCQITFDVAPAESLPMLTYSKK